MKRYAIRGILNGELPEIGSVLANSWHPAAACDWLTEDAELPGTCGFLCDSSDPEAIERGLSWLDCYWPGVPAVLIVGTLLDANEYGGLPEDNGCVLADATVVSIVRE